MKGRQRNKHDFIFCFPPQKEGGRCVAVSSLSKNSFTIASEGLPKGLTPKASAKVETFRITTKHFKNFLKEKMKNEGKQDTGDGIKERNEVIRRVQRDEGKLR